MQQAPDFSRNTLLLLKLSTIELLSRDRTSSLNGGSEQRMKGGLLCSTPIFMLTSFLVKYSVESIDTPSIIPTLLDCVLEFLSDEDLLIDRSFFRGPWLVCLLRQQLIFDG